MKKEEFELQYSIDSGITLEEYHNNFVTVPCHCEYKDCKGWACITNNSLSIRAHNNIYNK